MVPVVSTENLKKKKYTYLMWLRIPNKGKYEYTQTFPFKKGENIYPVIPPYWNFHGGHQSSSCIDWQLNTGLYSCCDFYVIQNIKLHSLCNSVFEWFKVAKWMKRNAYKQTNSNIEWNKVCSRSFSPSLHQIHEILLIQQCNTSQNIMKVTVLYSFKKSLRSLK